MNKPRFDKILDLLTGCSYLGVVFLIPLYFSIIPKTSNVFELNKIVLFRVMVLLFFWFGFTSLLYKRRVRQRILIIFNLKKNYLVVPALYLLGLIFLTVFSPFPGNSFWGSYDRQMGLYSYSYFFVFFCLLIINIEKKEQINRILYTISLSSFFVCVYGIAQISGHDPLGWFESTHSRIFSSLGQPNILASFLLLTIPISVFLFVNTKNKLQKLLFGFNFLLQLFCLFFTYSRAGLLGLFAGLFLFLVAYLLKYLKEKEKSKLKPQTYIITILGLLISLSLLWAIFPTSQKDRFRLVFDLHQGSTASRADYWQASWKGFCEKPFLGYGLENQGEVMAKYYQRDWAIFNNVNSINDRAHNIILDTLLTGGLIGLIIYIFLNYYFVKLALENIRKNYYAKLCLAILLAWTCYSVSLLFGFSVVVTEVYFWLYLAILVIINFEGSQKENEFFVDDRKNKIISKIFKVIIFLVISAGVILQLNQEIKVVIADVYFYKLESSLSSGEYFAAFVLNDWIKELKIRDNYYERNLARGLSRAIEKNTNEIWSVTAKKTIFPQTLPGVESDSYKDVCTRAKMYTAMASEKNPEFYGIAEENFRLCISKGDSIPENYREFAKYFLKKGEYDKAIENLNISISKLPELSDKRINSDHKTEILRERYLIDVLFGDVYTEMKNYNLARDYYLLANADGGSRIFVNKKIADSYYLEGTKKKVIEILMENDNIENNNYFWSFLIAQIYSEMNEKEKALEYAERALTLSPGNEQVENFKNSLGILPK